MSLERTGLFTRHLLRELRFDCLTEEQDAKEILWPLDELRTKIDDWAARCEGEGSGELRIEVFLPDILLSSDVDQWRPPEVWDYVPPPVGKKYQVVVRSWDRIYNTALPPVQRRLMVSNWKRRWKPFEARRVLHTRVLDRGDFPSAASLEDGHPTDRSACFALSFPIEMHTEAEPTIERLLLMSGVPVALWRRLPPGQDSSVQERPWEEWLRTLEATTTLDEWEQQVHATRRDADCVYGSHATLVSDSPRKLPRGDFRPTPRPPPATWPTTSPRCP